METKFGNSDVVEARKDALESVFSYLGVRPRIRKGERYTIKEVKIEDNVEFYSVYGVNGFVHESVFTLVKRHTVRHPGEF